VHCTHLYMKQVWMYRFPSQWPRGLRRSFSAACLLRFWVRIPLGAWMFVCCECCVLSGKGLCDGLITRPEESYRMWRVVVCEHETSKTRRLSPLSGCENTTTMRCNTRKTTNSNMDVQIDMLLLLFPSIVIGNTQ